MFEHKAIIRWKCTSPNFVKGWYSREHTWQFDGGFTMPASPSPSVVPTPFSNPAHVDPEEAFVASVPRCQTLMLLSLASRRGSEIASYEDEAVGIMNKSEQDVPWMSQVTLNPRIVYGGGTSPTPAGQAHLQHLAHEQCYIANSVRTEILVRTTGGE